MNAVNGVRQRKRHVIRPTFVSEEEQLWSVDADLKGCYISTTSNNGHVFLPSVNAVSFSGFSFSLLQGSNSISLSLKCVLMHFGY